MLEVSSPIHAMNVLSTFLILLAAFLAVFWQAAFNGIRHLLGAQVDLLPALVVYASLASNFTSLTLLCVLGGLSFDALSVNPLGVTVLPLFATGLAIYSRRELILRDQVFAQVVLGLAASAAVPAMTVLLLLTMGKAPLIGWGSLWQWAVMAAGGAVATPVFFRIFEWFDRALIYRRASESSFRPDREIRRGRN
jgi:rod shape-determining protein MreD